MGIASTGKPVMFTTIVISRIVNGKFQEDWKSFDGMYVLQQLDALPTS
jgi:predicted ester cyclase